MGKKKSGGGIPTKKPHRVTLQNSVVSHVSTRVSRRCSRLTAHTLGTGSDRVTLVWLGEGKLRRWKNHDVHRCGTIKVFPSFPKFPERC